MNLAKAALEAAEGGVKWASNNTANFSWKSISEPALGYIKAHPGFLASPVLAWIGFSNIGPVAGSTAAGYQSMHGATWAFSGLQSAAMQGYGAPIINGAIQGASVASAAAIEALKWL